MDNMGFFINDNIGFFSCAISCISLIITCILDEKTIDGIEEETVKRWYKWGKRTGVIKGVFGTLAFLCIVWALANSGKTTIPNVTELLYEDAVDKVLKYELKHIEQESKRGKVVVSQSIPAGTIVKKDTTVELEVEDNLKYEKEKGNERRGQLPFAETLVYDNHTYSLILNHNGSIASTWVEAKEFCETYGGHLAVISSDEENNALYDYVKGLGYENAIFGFSDWEQEGCWKWCCETENKYTNWHGTTEPNAENEEEDCAEFFKDFEDGTWNDAEFGYNTFAFICEWDEIILND